MVILISLVSNIIKFVAIYREMAASTGDFLELSILKQLRLPCIIGSGDYGNGGRQGVRTRHPR